MTVSHEPLGELETRFAFRLPPSYRRFQREIDRETQAAAFARYGVTFLAPDELLAAARQPSLDPHFVPFARDARGGALGFCLPPEVAHWESIVPVAWIAPGESTLMPVAGELAALLLYVTMVAPQTAGEAAALIRVADAIGLMGPTDLDPDVEESIQRLAAQLVRDPGDPVALATRAVLALDVEQPDDARLDYEAALVREPLWPSLHSDLAQIAMKRGDSRSAVRHAYGAVRGIHPIGADGPIGHFGRVPDFAWEFVREVLIEYAHELPREQREDSLVAMIQLEGIGIPERWIEHGDAAVARGDAIAAERAYRNARALACESGRVDLIAAFAPRYADVLRALHLGGRAERLAVWQPRR